MSLGHGTNIVRDGLVFYYDIANTKKSWRGKPTTNFITNGHFEDGIGVTEESGSNPTNTIIYFPFNPGESEYVLQQNGTNAEYELQFTGILSSTTYCMSGWFAVSPDYDGIETMFHARAFSVSAAHTATGTGLYTVLDTKVIDGITWKYCYTTLTTPADSTGGYSWYVGYGATNTLGYRYYTNLQFELGDVPSPYLEGTRSNTQSLLDLTGNKSITMTNITYNPNNTFEFNGIDNMAVIQDPNLPQYNWSIEIVASYNDVSNSPILLNPLSYGVDQFIRFTSDGRINITLTEIADTNGRGHNSTYYATPGEEVHYVFTRTSTSVQIYVNGELNVEVSDTVISAPWSDTWSVGARHNSTFWYNGEIPILKLYNKVLKPTEVKQNFNAIRGRFGL